MWGGGGACGFRFDQPLKFNWSNYYVGAKHEIDCLPISDVLAEFPTRQRASPLRENEASVGCEEIQT